MRDAFLNFSPPSLSDAEREEVQDTLQSDWITTGPKVKIFESSLKDRLNAQELVALNSCTAGLHVALLTLGVGPGDEVIVPAMTFCATANVVEHVGAHPVIVDVCPDTLNMDPERVAEAITSKTKAIIPVHYGGHPADLDPLFELAAIHGLDVLEDAAHAIPAKYKGIPVGSRSNMAAFSFYSTKNLTTAEGGALTGESRHVDRARILGSHGMNRDAWKRFDRTGSWYYEVVAPGFKYNMTDIQASIGIRQLERLDGMQLRRREVVDLYREGLGAMEELQLLAERPEVESALHLFVVRLRPEFLVIDRDVFIDELKLMNIGASVHYLPVHMHPFYRDKYGLAASSCPVAADAFRKMFSIPLHPRLSDQDVQDVIEAVQTLVKRHRK